MLKHFRRQLTALALVLLLVMSTFSIAVFANEGIEITNEESLPFQDKLIFSVENDYESTWGTASVANDGKLTVTAKNDTSTCGHGATNSILTVTAKVNLDSFTFTATGWSENTAGWTSGSATVSNMAKGESKTFTIASGSSSASGTITVTGAVASTVSVNTTFKPTANGTFTVNGEGITTETVKNDPSTSPYALNAVPDSGYSFFGWYDETGFRLSTSTSFSYEALEAHTITPVFYKTGCAVYYILNEPSVFYDCLDTAAAKAATGTGTNDKIIFMASSGNLNLSGTNKNVTIPQGVTLQIPYSFKYSGSTHYDEPSFIGNATPAISVYRKLTVPSDYSIDVAGTLVVDSGVAAQGQDNGHNGVPRGPQARIEMQSGAAISVKSGGTLTAWGYITAADTASLTALNNTGNASVTVEDGGTLRECFQIRDWPGGTNAQQMYNDCSDYKVFPFRQYYVQNIEVPLKINKGATEQVTSAVYADGDVQALSNLAFIGESQGLFLFNGSSSDYLMRTYDAATDNVTYISAGDVTLNQIAFSMVIDVTSTEYTLPITSGMNIHVKSGKVDLFAAQDITMLPGSKITVDQGAELDVNGKLYLVDSDEWNADNYVFTTVKLRQLDYVAVKNGAPVTRNTNTDATLDINGTIKISGALYATSGKASIISSGKTGAVEYTKAAPNKASSYYERSTNSNTNNYVEFTLTPAYLHNGANRPEGVEEYTATAGSAANTAVLYCSDCDAWFHTDDLSHDFGSFPVTFEMNGHGTQVPPRNIRYYNLVAKPDDPAENGWTFGGWYEDASFEHEFDFASHIILEDTTIYAKWTPAVYTVKFDKNAGVATVEGTMADQTFSYQQLQMLSPNVFSRNGASFVSWNTKADGTGDTYSDAFAYSQSQLFSGMTDLEAQATPLVLYAQWDGEDYTISYDGNGGTGEMAAQTEGVRFGTDVTLDKNTFTRDGYAYNGWNTQADGTGDKYEDEQVVSDLGDITMYAHWAKLMTNSDITVTIPDQTYTGSAITPEPVVKDGNMTLTKDVDYTVSVEGTPTALGEYTVTITGKGYNYSGSTTATFKITKAANSVTVSIENWSYGTAPNAPAANAELGTATFTYSDAENGTYTSEVPSTVGTWYVKATVAETDQYEGATAVTSFEITPFDVNHDTFAADLTINDGSSTNNMIPAYPLYFDDFAKSQHVIPASQLADMAGAEISSLTYYTNTADFTSPADVEVRIGEVDYTSISSFESYDNLTLVYSGDLTTDASEKMTINFTAPFVYHGGNLLVSVNNPQNSGWKSCTFYGVTSNGSSISGANGTSADNITPSQQNFLPKTTFAYSASVSVTKDAEEVLGYDGTPKKPTINAAFGAAALTEGTDFDVTYVGADYAESATPPTDAADYTAKLTFKGNFTGVLEVPFTIYPPLAVDVTIPTQAYTGSALTPVLTVKDGDTVLTEGDDYTWNLVGEAVNVGDYTVNVVGKGSYLGSTTATFTVTQASNPVTVDIEDWTYGSNPKNPTSTAAFGASTVSYTYGDSADGDFSATVPTQAGTHFVKAAVPATANYAAGSAVKSFEIAPQNVNAEPTTGTLLVNNGTSTNNKVPAYPYYFDDFTKSQHVIPASQLADMAGGKISSLTYYTNVSNLTTKAAAEVRIGEVNYTSISSYESYDNLTLVYSGKLTTNASKEMTITFTEPYQYNGGNLLVSISNPQDTGYNSCNFYGVSSSGSSIAGSNSSSADSAPATQQNFLPKTTFAYQAPGSNVTAAQKANEFLLDTDLQSANVPTPYVKDGDVVLTEGVDYEVTSYVGRGDTDYAECATAPTQAGTYTANITFKGNYTGTKSFDYTVNTMLNKHSLTLDGTIGVNFYVLVPDGYNAANTTMDFSWGQKFINTNNYDPETPRTKTGVTGKPDGSYLKFTLPIAVKELNDDITVTLRSKEDGSIIATEVYKPTNYAYDIFGRDSLDGYTEERFAQLKELLRTMLINAANAQTHFNYNTEHPATYRFSELNISTELDSVTIPQEKIKWPASDAFSDITYYGSALNLEDENGYTLYFNVNEPDSYSVDKYHDVTATTTDVKGNTKKLKFHDEFGVQLVTGGKRLRIKMDGLAAAEITNDITLTYKGTTVTVNAGDYLDLALTSGKTDLVNLATSVYSYNQAAIAFFGGNNG